ncbi:MAG: hypothetical protein CVU19_04090 [Betaproteobacteria bacterium HGW-Betaproteobacteria-13]|jgi:hypothetical protein|nr:MAG: hypothetical protein CVU28_06715 [Betaproteobacteria bacterium HGW-Betaproteobacteria-21]PKO81986.1 MAG: hypothetical protein CVU19_04090 [Betaproteobacteria bacterium HGW-Betaproteobacteria-13]
MVLLSLPVAASALGTLALSVDRIEHPGFGLQGLQFSFPAGGRASLSIARLRVADRHWRNVRLDCAHGSLDATVVRCTDGVFRLPGLPHPLQISFRLDLATRAGTFAIGTPDGTRLTARLPGDGSVGAKVIGLDLAALPTWLPVLKPWSPTGRFDGELLWHPTRMLELTGRLAGGAFGSADGLHAAEKLALDVRVDAVLKSGRWDWIAELGWREGAAYLHPFFVEAGPSLHAHGQLRPGVLEVHEASVMLEGVEQLAASALINLATGMPDRLSVALAGADLAIVGPRWLAPLVAPAAGERLRFAGRVSGALEFEGVHLRALDAVFDEAGVSLAGGDGGPGLAFGPLSGHVPWRHGLPTRGELQIGGGRWQKLALGAFGLGVSIDERSIRVDRVRIPLLDGALVFGETVLNAGSEGWVGKGSLVIEPVSMRLLTDALDLPSMSGVLSGSIPGLRASPGEVVLDGTTVVSVFDGYLRATGLRVLEPFGVGSHLTADIEARHLDLEQLTETFSFGTITGFVDADVRRLELVRWRPVGFDARVSSSPGRYPRRISQRAVQNISALGGPGAMAAIQRSLLGFFDTFGYREIGLGCVLKSGVCEMSGIGDGAEAGRFVIVSGGGIPALDVIGYNRRVDWRELVERLQRVIEGNAAAEVR